MKSIILSVSCLVSCLLTAAAFAVELSDATNSQLVAELERRLTTGGPATGATASYHCDTSARLHLELINEAGESDKKDIYISDADVCDGYATELNTNRGRIRSLSLAAVCDTSARMHRFTLLPSGKFGKTTDVYLGDSAKCRAQAKAINTAK